MPPSPTRGFGPVLRIPSFQRLWLAQLLAQTAQNGIHLVQLVLIERLTGRSMHMGLMIAAFTLPPVLFSPLASMVVDRVPKRWIIIIANLLRGSLAIGYIFLLRWLDGNAVIWAVYAVTFLGAAVGTFFNPAVLAKIPMLVGEERLLTANSLFNITIAGAQLLGLLALAPAAVKLFGLPVTFGLMGGLYLLAFLLVLRLPRDPARRVQGLTASGGWDRMRREFREGWAFVAGNRHVNIAILHLTLVATLIMILAMLAPGLSARVLGLAPEDAVLVFAPAGLGMLISIAVLGRWGDRFSSDWLQTGMILLTGLSFAMLDFLSRDYTSQRIAILDIYPQRIVSLSVMVAITALFMGFALYSINTIAQTNIQRYSPPKLRGRVFTVQYMLANLGGLVPLLAAAALADLLGIPVLMRLLAMIAFFVGGLTFLSALNPQPQYASPHSPTPSEASDAPRQPR